MVQAMRQKMSAICAHKHERGSRVSSVGGVGGVRGEIVPLRHRDHEPTPDKTKGEAHLAEIRQ